MSIILYKYNSLFPLTIFDKNVFKKVNLFAFCQFFPIMVMSRTGKTMLNALCNRLFGPGFNAGSSTNKNMGAEWFRQGLKDKECVRRGCRERPIKTEWR